MRFLNGKMNKFLLLILLLSPGIVFADANQFLGGQIEDVQVPDVELGDNPYIPSTIKENEKLTDGVEVEGTYLMGAPEVVGKNLSFKDKTLSFGQEVQGKFDNRSTYLEFRDKEIFRKIHRKGKESFSFSYIKDEYTVTDPRSVFDRTFDNQAESMRGGSLHFGMDKYFYKEGVEFAWGVNFGAGLSTGKGIFLASGTQSDTEFKFWIVPIDLSLTMDIPVGRTFKLSLSGGPSVVGLFQSRNDKDNNEDGKRRRQVGTGYFGSGKLKVSLANMFSRNAFEMFSDYDMTNFYFNLESRYQNYTNFQDDITISGASFGIGFSFEYL